MALPARARAIVMAAVAACLLSLSGSAAAETAPPTARVEARSATLMAVGLVHADRMAIHLSRLLDNAPLRDVALTVVLRGVVHPTLAEADGSYTLQTKDLQLPGSAVVMFRIASGDVHEELEGAVRVAADPKKPEEKNSTRQLAWWVLNFAVCIGFLMLWNRRRKSAQPE